MSIRFAVSLVCFVALSTTQIFATGKDGTGTLVKPRKLRRLVANGKWHGCTALTRWNNAYWLAFRQATGHKASDGVVIVLRSSDTENWTQALEVDLEADNLEDTRDPQMLLIKERLFLYVNGRHNGRFGNPRMLYTDNGKSWSKPQPIYEDGFILWKPISRDGRFYAGAHKPGTIKERETHLVTSTDGIRWDKVSTIRAGRGASETTLYFTPAGRSIAFVRNQTHLVGSIIESDPPYNEWTERSAGVHLSGHSVYTFNGVTYLSSRVLDGTAKDATRIYGKGAGTVIYTYTDGKLVPYCLLPGGRDCAYMEAVQMGDEMLVSYYASGEYPDGTGPRGGADIYLAWVPLKRGK